MWAALLAVRQPEGKHDLEPPLPMRPGMHESHALSRLTNAVTRVKNLSLVTSATSASLSAAMFVPTRIPTWTRSPSSAGWMTVGRSLPSWGISRYAIPRLPQHYMY
jgi:hypothetical protein